MLLALLLACTTDDTSVGSACTVPAPTLSPSSGYPGDRVAVTLPVSGEEWETLVTVNGQSVALQKFDASDCQPCEGCIYERGCAHCGECDECASFCDECSQVATVKIPELPAGSYPVRVTNGSGATAAATLTVLAQDVDTADTSGDTSTDSSADTDTASDTSVDTDTGA